MRLKIKVRFRLRGTLYTGFIHIVNIKGIWAEKRQVESGDFNTVLIWQMCSSGARCLPGVNELSTRHLLPLFVLPH